MSMRNEEINGDLTVNRDVVVGKNLHTRGNAQFDHGVVVKGWLDAPNIKGAFKGLYASGSALKSAYPRPMPGWYALVGNAIPADVWRVDGDEWVPTGEKGGEPNMDLASLVERIEAAEEVMLGTESRVETAEEDIDALEVRMEAAEGDIDALGTADKEQRAYLLQRLQGRAEDSDALHDPHKWLGSVKDNGGLNALLDGLHASGEAGFAKAGFFRGNYGGSPFSVENIPVDYAEDTWLQSVRGRFVPDASGMGLMRSGDEYAVLWRKCTGGEWGVWERIAGGVGRAEKVVTGGEVFNDYENNIAANYAHAEGQGCSANGDASHAEGRGTDVEGHCGHAEGLRTIVENDCEHAEGCYNVSNPGTRHSIGVGTSDSDRRNAFEVMNDGRIYVLGVGGYDGVLDKGSDKTLQKVLEELHGGGTGGAVTIE